MTAPDLRERFERAGAGVTDGPGDLHGVVRRGRARQRRRRVAVTAATAAAAVAAVVAIPALLAGGRPGSLEPVEDVPTTTATPDPGPTTATLAWDHSRYGPDGVVRHERPEAGPVRTTDTAVIRAIGTPDGGVVAQSGPGGPIRWFGPDGGERELVPTDRWQRLLAVESGTVWFTRRVVADGEGDEERLLSVALAGDDAITDHGRSAMVESATDALAFGPHGTVAWLSCHLQCTVYAGSLSDLVAGDAGRQLAPAAYRAALDFDPDGSLLAVVDGPDPIVGGTSQVVVLDLRDGSERLRLDLGTALELATAAVAFAPDGRTLLVGDHTRAFVVTDLEGDPPRIEPLAGTGGVTLHVPEDEDAEGMLPGPDDARDVALTFAAEELGWPDAVAEDLDGSDGGAGDTGTTAIGLRRAPGEPVAPVHLTRDLPAGPWRITGGGHHAEGPDDPDGWWNGVQASDGTIRLGGQAPAWGGDRMTAWVLDGNKERTSSGPVAIGRDGTFEAALEVPEQRDRPVMLLLVTLDGDEVTSFAVLGIPPGEFAAG